jgi:ammonium transporter, Amt family
MTRRRTGLSLFYGGLVRTKNVISVLSSVLMIAALVTVQWILYAFSLAFDNAGMSKGAYNLHSFFGSLGNGGLRHVRTHALGSTTTYPLSTVVTFQLSFAIITVALISGAYVERMKHTAVMLFSSLWLLTVYCPLAHMVWSGDGALLHDLGVLDFAGGLVVHTRPCVRHVHPPTQWLPAHSSSTAQPRAHTHRRCVSLCRLDWLQRRLSGRC